MADRYELGDRVSTGEVSSVYRATSAAGQAAIKVLHPSLADDPIIAARFEREARLLAGISHDAIPKVLDLTAIDESPAIVMEYFEGALLAELDVGAVSAEMVLRKVAEALVELHARGISHRDIQPRSVLITGDGGLKIVGFGKASARDLAGLTRSTIISADTAYVDPYTWGQRGSGETADLYGLGAVTLFAALGEPPAVTFLAGRKTGELAAQINRIRDESVWYLPEIVAALLDAPSKRPRSAVEVLQWLNKGETVASRRLTTCIRCGGTMPSAAALCPQCGKEPPVLTTLPGDEGTFIELTSISESQEVLGPFLTKLKALSETSLDDIKILTGDTRLYSKAEKERGNELPVRLVDGLSPDSAEYLSSLLQAHAPGKIKLKTRPMSQIGRVKRGPLIEIRPGKQIPPATIDTLRRLAPNQLALGQAEAPRGASTDFDTPSPARGASSRGGGSAPQRGSAPRGGAAPSANRLSVQQLRNEAWNALSIATRRLAATSAGALLDSERIEAIWGELRAVLDAIERAERYLASADLAETYTLAERARLRGEPEDEARAARLFEQYEAVEQSLLQARGQVVAACGVLEEIAPTTASSSLDQIAQNLSQVAPDLGRGIY
ncbi:MAG: protein kinase domain-containing protein [Spirochaetales bacterium]